MSKRHYRNGDRSRQQFTLFFGMSLFDKHIAFCSARGGRLKIAAGRSIAALTGGGIAASIGN
jgi:hypothetical protein